MHLLIFTTSIDFWSHIWCHSIDRTTYPIISVSGRGDIKYRPWKSVPVWPHHCDVRAWTAPLRDLLLLLLPSWLPWEISWPECPRGASITHLDHALSALQVSNQKWRQAPIPQQPHLEVMVLWNICLWQIAAGGLAHRDKMKGLRNGEREKRYSTVGEQDRPTEWRAPRHENNPPGRVSPESRHCHNCRISHRAVLAKSKYKVQHRTLITLCYFFYCYNHQILILFWRI